ncbi:MAG: hypothetical protein HC815_21580, partial [Richelia sp. RM1_1_1]|nr:hypothetical protein [Richelia sp. RM1_1_1]
PHQGITASRVFGRIFITPDNSPKYPDFFIPDQNHRKSGVFWQQYPSEQIILVKDFLSQIKNHRSRVFGSNIHQSK